MDGDWYARGIYEQGSGHYKYHLAHYGHPSVFGYKDIIPLWKAEKWDPDRLMQLYKKAGAKYFVSMGSHHDNFFLWNSKLHRWNAVNMGPQSGRRRRLAEGGEEVRPPLRRLRASRAPASPGSRASHGSDKTGPKAGVPYDGADPQYQDLYHFPADPPTRGWYSNNPKWQQQWYDGIKELVDNYHPDLLYSDGGVPFGNDVGLQHDRPPLQLQRGPPRRQGRGGLQLQAGLRGPLGRGPRTRHHAPDRPQPVADRHLHRRLVLQPQLEVPPGHLGDPHARR